MKKIIAVIGAGPKGLALAVKSLVLNEFMLGEYEVILIEKNQVAANWSGNEGYTNGNLKLGTPPEKDIIFPNDLKTGSIEVDKKIQSRLMEFSWNFYKMQSNSYSEWIDRGKPSPTHKEWSNYLNWIACKIKDQIKIIHAEVISCQIKDKQWLLELKNKSNDIMTLKTDGLVLTGPGATKIDFPIDQKSLDQGHLYDLESFWREWQTGFSPKKEIAIIGTGENTASLLQALGEKYPHLSFHIVSSKGYITSRSENFYENQIYSQPEKNQWQQLSEKDKKDFISRTDIGVFSQNVMRFLNENTKHQIHYGRVISIKTNSSNRLELTLKNSNFLRKLEFDQVILATGFDYSKVLKKILCQQSFEFLNFLSTNPETSFNDENLSHLIDSDLSIKGLTPKLFIPMLAGLTQGPGFNNLSCLGKLADRVLTSKPNYQVRFLSSDDKEELFQLRKNAYAQAKGFALDLERLRWNTSDDQSYILGIFQDQQLISTMRAEVIEQKTVLEKKLECPWNFPVNIDGPVLLLSRAATEKAYSNKGLNLLQRGIFLEMAKAYQLSHLVGTFVPNSPREETLRKMGYQFFSNSMGWQESHYHSFGSVYVVCLNLDYSYEKAAAFIQEQLPTELYSLIANFKFNERTLKRVTNL